MTAGVQIEGGVKKFFFFEPNYGIATFDSVESFQKGLHNIFTSKKLPRAYISVGKEPGKLGLNVSDYSPSAFDQVGISPSALKDMYSAPL